MSALGEGLHPWRPAATEPWVVLDWCDPHAGGQLLVADSWRVVDGRVRGLERHRARFIASASEHRDDAARFFGEVVAALPRSGDWFPRVELRERGEGTQLSLWLRPTPGALSRSSPEPSTTVDVVTAHHDPRTRPLVKGPDLDALGVLRREVRRTTGADEAIIVDARGRIIEGAYSGLLWWQGDVLVRPSDAVPRIPSVTVDLIVEAARAAGVSTVEADARADDLTGCELWVLSALHGLRTAREWFDGPALAAPQRAELGRAWLAAADVTLDRPR